MVNFKGSVTQGLADKLSWCIFRKAPPTTPTYNLGGVLDGPAQSYMVLQCPRAFRQRV